MSITKNEILARVRLRLDELEAEGRAVIRGAIGALVDDLDVEPISDVAGLCDDIRVLTEIAMRTDGMIGVLLESVHALHAEIGRKMNDRIRKLEDAARRGAGFA